MTLRLTPANCCIYCGIKELPQGLARFSDEHIFPLALGGKIVLPEASCKACERTINKEVETPICSHEYGAFRAKRGYPSRHPRKRIQSVSVSDVRGERLLVDVGDHPAPVPIYDFGTAGVLSGRPVEIDEVSGIGWDVRVIGDMDQDEPLKSKHPTWDGTYRLKFQPYAFARLIAKICHGYVTALLGREAFVPALPDVILGMNPYPLRWIGGGLDGYNNKASEDQPWVPHFRPTNHTDRQPLMMDLRFFEGEGRPRYHALVGWIDPKDELHMRLFRKRLSEGVIIEKPTENV